MFREPAEASVLTKRQPTAYPAVEARGTPVPEHRKILPLVSSERIEITLPPASV